MATPVFAYAHARVYAPRGAKIQQHALRRRLLGFELAWRGAQRRTFAYRAREAVLLACRAPEQRARRHSPLVMAPFWEYPPSDDDDDDDDGGSAERKAAADASAGARALYCPRTCKRARFRAETADARKIARGRRSPYRLCGIAPVVPCCGVAAVLRAPDGGEPARAQGPRPSCPQLLPPVR